MPGEETLLCLLKDFLHIFSEIIAYLLSGRKYIVHEHSEYVKTGKFRVKFMYKTIKERTIQRQSILDEEKN